MTPPQEATIWEGHPSHALNFWLNLSCLLILPIPWAFARWLQLRNHHIQITTERVRVTTGIFSKRSEDMELYRVRDLSYEQPFLLRLFGRGNLLLNSSDVSTPAVVLRGVPADTEFRDGLRRAIEECRDRKRARVSELGGTVDMEEQSAPGEV